jgi:hypothetical protein
LDRGYASFPEPLKEKAEVRRITLPRTSLNRQTMPPATRPRREQKLIILSQ